MPALSASVLRGIYRRFVLLLDVEVRFDCAGSHKVSWRLLSASVLRGMYRRFVLLLDVEMRFDCEGSHKVSWRLLSASVSRGMYRRFVLLLDVEMRFDCEGSHKVSVDFCPRAFRVVFAADSCFCLMYKCVSAAQARANSIFCFFGGSGTVGVLSRGPAARVVPGSIPALSARVGPCTNPPADFL